MSSVSTSSSRIGRNIRAGTFRMDMCAIIMVNARTRRSRRSRDGSTTTTTTMNTRDIRSKARLVLLMLAMMKTSSTSIRVTQPRALTKVEPDIGGRNGTVLPEQDGAEDGLGEDVEDAVEDGLGIRMDDVPALAQTPRNGVQEPDEHQVHAAGVVGGPRDAAEAHGVPARVP